MQGMMIYIQLLKDTNLLENDLIVHRKVGEWLDVQRNVAVRLLIEGRARVLDYPALLTEYEDICLVTGNTAQLFELDYTDSTTNLTIEASNNIYLAHELTNPITILTGLQALQNWHVAIPLRGIPPNNEVQLMTNYDYSTTEDLQTKAIIRDLRVPAYDSDIIFYRNSDHAKRWLDEYSSQLQNGVTPPHALIRSLYITKPYHIALPAGSIR